MTYASKTDFCLNNFKILRPKVKKNLTNLRKNFCEFPHIHLKKYWMLKLKKKFEQV